MKTVFWKQAVSDVFCHPCPFRGVNVNDIEDFKEKVVKGMLFKQITSDGKGYYPPVLFSTSHPHVELLFQGSYKLMDINNHNTGKLYKWLLLDTEKCKIIAVYDKDNFHKIFKWFEDTSSINEQLTTVTQIVEKQGYVTFTLSD